MLSLLFFFYFRVMFFSSLDSIVLLLTTQSFCAAYIQKIDNCQVAGYLPSLLIRHLFSELELTTYISKISKKDLRMILFPSGNPINLINSGFKNYAKLICVSSHFRVVTIICI